MYKIKNIVDVILTSRLLIYIGMVLGVMVIVYLALSYGILFAAIFSAIPLLFFIFIIAVSNNKLTFYTVFIVNYFLMGITRYIPSIKAGILLDALLMIVFGVLLLQTMHRDVKWRAGVNTLSILAMVWFTYCFFQLFNPMEVTEAWVKSIRGIAIYFLIISVLTPILLPTFKDFRKVMMILSVLTIIAVAKVLIQKYYGFDIYEKRWLYLEGGARTHIIYSGIRYFSFFTDAANYGAAMGFASVIFGLQSGYTEKKWQRYYYLLVSMVAIYGLLMSGTRGAVFIPIAGVIVWIGLSKNFKKIVIGTLAIITVLSFLLFSNLGNSNSFIRRTRSAFNKDDASFIVRKENQNKLSEIMVDLPFGTGIGMGGGKAKLFAPDAKISQIPTDSWYVLLWVETGIVGIILYLAIQLYVMAHGAYLILFKLRHPVVRGCITAVVCGLSGSLVAAYGNEIWGQLPNIYIFTICQAFIFMSPNYDKELTKKEEEASQICPQA